jgi:hypothetical protein
MATLLLGKISWYPFGILRASMDMAAKLLGLAKAMVEEQTLVCGTEGRKFLNWLSNFQLLKQVSVLVHAKD